MNSISLKKVIQVWLMLDSLKPRAIISFQEWLKSFKSSDVKNYIYKILHQLKFHYSLTTLNGG